MGKSEMVNPVIHIIQLGTKSFKSKLSPINRPANQHSNDNNDSTKNNNMIPCFPLFVHKFCNVLLYATAQPDLFHLFVVYLKMLFSNLDYIASNSKIMGEW
jgi:hypothetical protein